MVSHPQVLCGADWLTLTLVHGLQKVTQTRFHPAQSLAALHRGFRWPRPARNPVVAFGSPITMCSALDMAAVGPGAAPPCSAHWLRTWGHGPLVGSVEEAAPFHVFSVFCSVG